MCIENQFIIVQNIKNKIIAIMSIEVNLSEL